MCVLCTAVSDPGMQRRGSLSSRGPWPCSAWLVALFLCQRISESSCLWRSENCRLSACSSGRGRPVGSFSNHHGRSERNLRPIPKFSIRILDICECDSRSSHVCYSAYMAALDRGSICRRCSSEGLSTDQFHEREAIPVLSSGDQLVYRVRA
jgi:hypothetical protein